MARAARAASPTGYDRGEAWKQLVAFGKLIGPIAERQSVTIVVEPLNLRECNVLTTVGESGQYVEEVDHPYFQAAGRRLPLAAGQRQL